MLNDKVVNQFNGLYKDVFLVAYETADFFF